MTLLPIMTKFYSIDFVGGRDVSRQIQDGGRQPCRKMIISPYWLKVFPPNVVQRCNTTVSPKRGDIVNFPTDDYDCHGGTCRIHLS